MSDTRGFIAHATDAVMLAAETEYHAGMASVHLAAATSAAAGSGAFHTWGTALDAVSAAFPGHGFPDGTAAGLHADADAAAHAAADSAAAAAAEAQAAATALLGTPPG